MALLELDGRLFREMLLNGASILETNRANVDALNVFPVPDGDTGTNMSMTMMAAAREVRDLDTDNISEVADAAARGALRGARGNSGVILSQLFRGFSRSVDKNGNLDSTQFATALKEGSETAYKSVMKPREGTILTVARAVADSAVKTSGMDIYGVLEEMLDAGEKALRKTPEQLPVLKKAGVVDAGGKGLLLIYAGFKMALDGEEVDISQFDFGASEPIGVEFVVEDEDIHFAYCTEMFIKNLKEGMGQPDIDHFREKLSRIGDCVMVVGDLELTKVHVHSNAPGKVLQMGLALGEISNIKIDNMREQHRSLADGADAEKMTAPSKPVGFVSVAAGEGLAAVFRDLTVDKVVEGGQTMNPSIDDIHLAIDAVHARTVFVLPNNSNIIMAAQQAAQMCDCKVIVIPTKSVPQGIAAMIAYMPGQSDEANEAAMVRAIQQVHTGQVTYSVRSIEWEDKPINEGDILGLCDGQIICYGTDVEQVAKDLLENMVTSESEIISIFHGADIPPDKAEHFFEEIETRFSDQEVDLINGGQPLYYYLFSVE